MLDRKYENNLSIGEIKSICRSRKPGALGKYRFYSVLVPIVEKDGQLNLLYEVRAENLRVQPGEICFPGGAMEKNETGKQCAIRETCEELGLKKKNIKTISQLDTLYTYSNFTMYCYLGQISYEVMEHAQINQKEVKEWFLLPLDFIIKNEPYIYKLDIIPDVGADFPYDMLKLNNGYNWRKGISEVPIYTYDNKIIWGLTARITHNLAKIIREGKRG